MKLSFSERLGLKKVRTELVKENLTAELRNSLWTVVADVIIPSYTNQQQYNQYGETEKYSPLAAFYRKIWRDFFKLPTDQLHFPYGVVDSSFPYDELRRWFFSADWNSAYDLIEFFVDEKGEKLDLIFNMFLKREFSAYRFVGKALVEINSKEEIVEIETALNISDKFKPVKIHLATALNLISDKKKPDYRNSIKESISAVESLCKLIINDSSASLGAALKTLEQKHNIPNSLKAGFSAIYGYTSDESGIRHGLLNGDVEVGIDEARFMLIACSAFINYLTSKI